MQARPVNGYWPNEQIRMFHCRLKRAGLDYWPFVLVRFALSNADMGSLPCQSAPCTTCMFVYLLCNGVAKGLCMMLQVKVHDDWSSFHDFFRCG